MSAFSIKIAAVICLAAATCGCIFAPAKFGPRGVVLPGDSQFELYLANCSRRYPELADCCERWGTPSAIQIGHSGGYFVWRGQERWLRVKSFSATLETRGLPRALLPYALNANGCFDSGASPQKNAGKAKRVAPSVQYEVMGLSRAKDDDFAYEFKLRLKDGADAGISAMNRIKQEMRQAVVMDYMATYGGNAAEVKVDFPEFSMKDSIIDGRAEVMRLSMQYMHYDADTRKGVIAIKIGANSFEEARKWVRKNIETLARDKNIALTTGQLPAEARFYLGAERVKEGDVLEIEFETE